MTCAMPANQLIAFVFLPSKIIKLTLRIAAQNTKNTPSKVLTLNSAKKDILGMTGKILLCHLVLKVTATINFSTQAITNIGYIPSIMAAAAVISPIYTWLRD